jgi:DNA modification methylase
MPEMERRSFIATDDYARWFSPIWADVTGQLRTDHPAPYPVEIPRRLIRMFSFAGDTVVDPFGGTGTTAIAALYTGRNSITVEIESSYVQLMAERLQAERLRVLLILRGLKRSEITVPSFQRSLDSLYLVPPTPAGDDDCGQEPW